MPQTHKFRQVEFSGGYLSPQLLSRVDEAKYTAGLAQARNVFVNRTSGVQSRTGSLWQGATKNQTAGEQQLLDMVISNEQSYEMEIGPDYIRPWRSGSNVPLSPTLAHAYTPGV